MTTQTNIINTLLLLMLSIAILIMGTGIYEADILPKDEYVVTALSLALLVIGYGNSRNFNFVPPKILLGFIIFNIFFALRISFPLTQDVELKTYFIHFISLGSFIAIYSISRLIFSSNEVNKYLKTEIFISALSIISLFIILLSQILQIHNNSLSILSRPGGFFIPNSTAAIALIFMFTVYKLSAKTHTSLVLISVILTTAIVLLAQSRSALIAFVPFVIYIMFKMQLKIYLVALIFFFLLLLSDALITSFSILDLIKETATRFLGESSSNRRLLMLREGWLSFLESPIFGNGYQHIYKNWAFTTHNEIIEILSSFGMIGLIFIGVASYFLYTPFSTVFCFVCVLPTFIFSNNFFDMYAIQAILGMALAVDRRNQHSLER